MEKSRYGVEGKAFKNTIEKYLMDDLQIDKSVSRMWSDFEVFCVKNAKKTLRISKDEVLLVKDPKWWNNEKS
jgi:hypothetical protein